MPVYLSIINIYIISRILNTAAKTQTPVHNIQQGPGDIIGKIWEPQHYTLLSDL